MDTYKNSNATPQCLVTKGIDHVMDNKTKYKTYLLAHEKTGISKSGVYHRFKLEWDIDDIINIPPSDIHKTAQRKYEYKDKYYTASELAYLASKNTNSVIPTRTIYNRLNADWTMDDVVNTSINTHHAKARHKLYGEKVTMNELYILANGYYGLNIAYETLHDRIFKSGYSPEYAISQPVLKRKAHQDIKLLLPLDTLQKQATAVIATHQFKLKK